jgi:hypothetical protein
VHEVLRSPGQSLDAATREFMEPRFGQDFSRVRVHTDAKAAESARAVNALAYTIGRDVVFENGMYAPHTDKGRGLLAHELTHVLQQRQAVSPWLGMVSSDAAREAEAKSISDNIGFADSAQTSLQIGKLDGSSGSMLQRVPGTAPALPYDPGFGPSSDHCAIYQSPLAETWFTFSYRHNARCACQQTPDEPHNNCVRKCLQVKMRSLLSSLDKSGAALPMTFPFEADPMCPDMWRQHVQCYKECGCANSFINYPIFSTMCRMPFPCFFVQGSIDWFNSCM